MGAIGGCVGSFVIVIFGGTMLAAPAYVLASVFQVNGQISVCITMIFWIGIVVAQVVTKKKILQTMLRAFVVFSIMITIAVFVATLALSFFSNLSDVFR